MYSINPPYSSQSGHTNVCPNGFKPEAKRELTSENKVKAGRKNADGIKLRLTLKEQITGSTHNGQGKAKTSSLQLASGVPVCRAKDGFSRLSGTNNAHCETIPGKDNSKDHGADLLRDLFPNAQ